uniref:Glutathione transferase n=1 Tax=Alexandrium monilatum TaxID=311494 RepID=A0A7S4Q9D7_9DINO|mmetsp:Transcript_97226/g.290438  ORF Transcript_97226/g.290438 Transcript_97226/m.290438 type:complete len:227 (-) Transcript_97226:120-800(-)
MPKVKLTYFDIEAAAEKVRLALVMTGTEFEDCRIKREDWDALKASTPYGQLPVMEVTAEDGTVKKFAQSVAMLRWAARKFDTTNTLYPADADAMLEIEEVIGLADDLSRAWMPGLYIGMGDRHQKFGHPEEWPEKPATVQRLREAFVAEELPKFMGFYAKKLEATGAFFCGDKPTIADLYVLPQLRYYTKGVADYVPADCLAPYTTVTAWMDRMYAIPEIKKWYNL